MKSKEFILNTIEAIKSNNYDDLSSDLGYLWSVEKNLYQEYEDYDNVFITDGIMDVWLRLNDIKTENYTFNTLTKNKQTASLFEKMNLRNKHKVYYWKYMNMNSEDWKFTNKGIEFRGYTRGSKHDFEQGKSIEAHSNIGLNYFKNVYPKKIYLKKTTGKFLWKKTTLEPIMIVQKVLFGYLVLEINKTKSFKKKLQEYKESIKELDLSTQ